MEDLYYLLWLLLTVHGKPENLYRNSKFHLRITKREKYLCGWSWCVQWCSLCALPLTTSTSHFLWWWRNMSFQTAPLSRTFCFYIISLCLTNLNCCLDQVVYYFITSEFHDKFSEHGGLVFQSCVSCNDSVLEIHHEKEDHQVIYL